MADINALAASLRGMTPGQFLGTLVNRPQQAQPSPQQQPATQPTQFNPSGSVTTYYVPNYQGAGPRYITIGVGAGWQWDTPESYNQKVAAGTLPRVPLQDANAFNAFNQQFQAQAQQDRAAALSQAQGSYQNTALDPMRRAIAFVSYINQNWHGQDAKQFNEWASAQFKTLPPDMQQAVGSMYKQGGTFFGHDDNGTKDSYVMALPLWYRYATGGLLDPSESRMLGTAAAAPQDNLPKPGTIDIYNPGGYLAELLRSQRPGTVMGTKVPRPNQITQATANKLDPTQLQTLLAYGSAVGIPQESYLNEMRKFFLEPSPYKAPRNLA